MSGISGQFPVINPTPPSLFGRLARRWRLRHKLALILLLAALLPVATASTLGVRLVLNGLETGVTQEIERSRRVALNLVLGQVKEIFAATLRLAGSAELAKALPLEAGAGEGTRAPTVAQLLSRRRAGLPPGLIEIADARGVIVASRVEEGQGAMRLANNAPPIVRALAYERRVTIERVGPMLAVRVAAPVVDDDYQLRGAVVVTVPLDAEFADRIKAGLSADVIFYTGSEPSSSSFVVGGQRQIGFPLPPAALVGLGTGGTASVSDLSAWAHRYAVGAAPLADIDGNRVGAVAVVVDIENVVRAKRQAWRSIVFGAAVAVLVAMLLAALGSRRITRPLGHLHAGARAVGRGELRTNIARETGDEIGDLAEAFGQMTRAIRANQETLAARMREIETLHKVGRAITSVLGVDEVLRKIVDEVAAVLSARRSALLLADYDGHLDVGAGVGLDDVRGFGLLGEELAWRGGPVLVDDIANEVDLRAAAARAGVTGSLIAVPLEQKDRILGLLIVNRPPQVQPFTQSDLRLVATLADNLATAIQNARLYDAVQRSSEELELKVKERTFELVAANEELERTLHELGQAQAQLVLSERMAGLGSLVAGIAHEINSPAGAIQGANEALGDNVAQLARHAREIGELAMAPEDRTRYFAMVERLAPRLATAKVEAPALVRKRSREMASRLEARGVKNALEVSRTIIEMGVPDIEDELGELGARYGMESLIGYLQQYAYLHRNTFAIATAIQRISRIVGALKRYSHLDQAKVSPADIHEGIENTLVILHHELKYGISVTRKFAQLPTVPVYVDELNQVWTNLIHNAVQALQGRGEIVIETRLDGDHVAVMVGDTGPGIPIDILGRIFEPFFTTKPKGEGTGLGLGIVKQIVDKHGGRIDVESKPGDTRFTVYLPVAGPPTAAGMGGVSAVTG